jgi:hypothetical protein
MSMRVLSRLVLFIFSGCLRLQAWNLPNHHHHHHPSHHPCTRRGFGETFVVAGTLLATTPVMAEDTSAFDAVRRELYSSDGGVAYMQRCLDQNDFTALLEFTKTYDQVLRKGAMGQAKKSLLTEKETATQYSNAVTFDLIGINRSSRPGKENASDAAKYLQELREDVQRFLELEGK